MKGIKITGKKRKYKFKIIGFIEIKRKKAIMDYWFIFIDVQCSKI